MDKFNSEYEQFIEENKKNEEEKGLKFDTGKPLVGTILDVFPNALMGIGQLIEFGTHKYPSPTNCLLVNNGNNRYKNALMRHLIKHSGGEIIDKETKLPHLYAVAWNALILIEFFIKEHPELRVFDDNRNIE